VLVAAALAGIGVLLRWARERHAAHQRN